MCSGGSRLAHPTRVHWRLQQTISDVTYSATYSVTSDLQWKAQKRITPSLMTLSLKVMQFWTGGRPWKHSGVCWVLVKQAELQHMTIDTLPDMYHIALVNQLCINLKQANKQKTSGWKKTSTHVFIALTVQCTQYHSVCCEEPLQWWTSVFMSHLHSHNIALCTITRNHKICRIKKEIIL